MKQSSPESMIVAMAPDVVFERRDVGGCSRYVARQMHLGKYFHFGAEEYHVASLLDGQRSLPEVGERLVSDGIDWDPEELTEFIGKLIANKLAVQVGRGSSPPLAPSLPWSLRVQKYLGLVVSQRIPLCNGNRIASALDRRIGWVFTKTGIIYWMGLVISGLMIVIAHRRDFGDELMRMFDPDVWLLLILMWLFAKVIHELGHAAAARHRDVRVGKIGIMFFLLAPLAYVDVTDAWKLRNRWHRVQIALAGVYLELAIAAIAAWAWWLLPGGYAKHLAAQLVLVAGPATLLVNANPLLRLDGYYVLSDLCEIPNLRMHGRRQLVDWLNRLLLGKEATRSLLVGWRRWFASLHAVASVAFQVVWMSGLIIGVSMWARGLGIVLAIAATLLWGILPLSRWAFRMWFSQSGGRLFLNDTRVRLLCYGAMLLMLVENLSMSDSPLARRVPVVVQFHDEQIARAAVDAFVEHVHVVRGQRVSQGMLLLELHDPELLLTREKKADDLRLAELRGVQFRQQGLLSQAAAEVENARSLRRQLDEIDTQIQSLRVVAARDGLVVGPQIDNLMGRYLHRGDELLRVCDPQAKELLIAVAESDVQAYQRAAKRAEPTMVRLRGGTHLRTLPARLRPRARRVLPHPALSATVGGPLAVEPAPQGQEDVRLVEAHMESRSLLDPATSAIVRAGQTGTMTIADDRSVFDRMLSSMRR